MGTGFTQLTGWEPGDPAAWRDAARYALNRAKSGGWGSWYGAAAVGVGKWDGIDRNHFWDANAERWDFENDVSTRRVTYNRHEPPHPQDLSYDCSQESLEWALWALGRQPNDDWMESAMQSEGVMNPDVGCTDASGAGLAAFVRRHYGSDGFDANNETNVSWDWMVHEGMTIPPGDGSGHAYPVLIGGQRWYHWACVRDYDPGRDVLLIANSADGYGGVGQTLNKSQWDRLGPFNAVRIWHPDLLGGAPPKPPAGLPTDTRIPRARELAEQIITTLDEPYP